ncbi:Integrase core domain protein [Pseudovibrio axinellae]|uniref:Integrase core domain protein n=1 Tax=Pseudovibrio axinellae TaxID=989403 RepID=A0A165YBN7_9HYPH|nr:IS481 family transposase [Pseudovibrio axinellae]KZL18644.1 Integrase core domain protein [Pseudovibrio axinellae]SER73520.1 Integrase core domain-containing protein [Pseudovibrio axinellae]
MGQLLHGSATTTHAVRAAIQRSQATITELSKQYDLNPKTVMKWRSRASVEDLPMGPRTPRSTVLSVEEEALCVAFRKHTLLPLDDCLYALQETIPHLRRSSLHRLFQRHGISRLPTAGGDQPKKRFKSYPIGYFHIDIAEVRTAQGKLHMFVAIDRTTKFVFVELHERATRRIAKEFLQRLIEAVPYIIHTVLSDNGVHFTDPKGEGWSVAQINDMLAREERFLCVGFDLVCAENDIDHRLTKPTPPWTNGQVERMNRTIKEATVRRYYYETHDQLRTHLAAFVSAYNFAKRLKTLKGLTPAQFIAQQWIKEPERFKKHPDHLFTGPNN